MEPFELTAGDLLLRPWKSNEAEAVWAAAQDPLMQRWNGRGLGSPAEVGQMIARLADWTGGDHCSWAVVAEDQLAGSVSLHAINRDQRQANVGYWTSPDARGRGIAPRVTSAVCEWAFPALQLDRVQLFHAVGNEASGRVAAKAGFTCEGRLRRSYRYGDGTRHDELLWARLADDPPPVLSRRS